MRLSMMPMLDEVTVTPSRSLNTSWGFNSSVLEKSAVIADPGTENVLVVRSAESP